MNDDADASDEDSVADAPTCYTIGAVAGDCGGANYPLVGDPAACGLSTSERDNSSALCFRLCGGDTTQRCWLVTEGGQPEVTCGYGPGCTTGRRPEGLAAFAFPGRRARDHRIGCVGRYFAHAAYLEAASVRAFRTLARELRDHGAPARLVRAAERAAREEIRHARATASLARRHGAPIARRPKAPRARTRTLEAIAIENAVEGCVRETFGALVAMWQARASEDPDVRAAMARIAPDETGHASLAWEVEAWAKGALDRAARARVDRARRAAIEELGRELGQEPDAELVTIAGLPPAAVARELLGQMKRELWRA